MGRRERIQRMKYEEAMQEKWVALRFLCVDCGKDTSGGEYYSVRNDVWAASGLAPNGGMLCLACLERRIERPLTGDDFTCMWPSGSAWQRHIAMRSITSRNDGKSLK